MLGEGRSRHAGACPSHAAKEQPRGPRQRVCEGASSAMEEKHPPMPIPRAVSGPSLGKDMGEERWTAGKCSPEQCPGVWERGGWLPTTQSIHTSLGLLSCTIARVGARCRGSGAQCWPRPQPDPHGAGELHGSGPPEQLSAATLMSGSGFPHQRVRFECDIYPVISRLWSLLGKRL